MKEMRFTWNETKAQANLTKHKISFNEATSVFSDDNARLIYDPDHSLEEERFLLLGMRYNLNLAPNSLQMYLWAMKPYEYSAGAN